MMKWMQEERGSVAVFLLVVLLPILLFEGAIFDGIRLVGSKSILTDAALNSLDSGLAGYDRDLKNAYGLYAVTDSAKAEQDVSRYFCRTVDPKGQGVDGADENATFFFNMPAKVRAGGSKGSELSNREVFEGQIREYIGICDELGLSALVETHDEAEVETALSAGARLIGVNNRNLKDFTVDTGNSRRLREKIPKEVLFVSESGVRNAEDVENLRRIGADAVLVGETLMRAEDKKKKLEELKGII